MSKSQPEQVREGLTTRWTAALSRLDTRGYRVLHLSDLHFAKEPMVVSIAEPNHIFDWQGVRRPRLTTPASHNPLAAYAVARFTWYHREALDLVLLTGDTATTGDLEDLQAGYGFVATRRFGHWASHRQPTIGGTGLDRYLLPGNHDRYGPRQLGFRTRPYAPGGTRFDRVFGKYWPAGQGVHRYPLRRRAGMGALAIIAADFTLESSDFGTRQFACGWMGQGRVSDQVLNRLISETNRTRREYPDAGIVWAVHFPPAFPNLSKENILLNDTALLGEAARLDVQHIFCGHTHIRHSYVTLGGCTIHCIGSCTHCAVNDGNTLAIYSINVVRPNDVRVTTVEYRFDRRGGNFEPI